MPFLGIPDKDGLDALCDQGVVNAKRFPIHPALLLGEGSFVSVDTVNFFRETSVLHLFLSF